MAFKMSLIDRREREYDVSVLVAGGGTDTVGALSFAVLRTDEQITAATVWKSYTMVNGIMKVIFVSPAAAAQSNDLGVFPGGANIYMREVKGDLVLVTFVEQITVT